MLELLKRYVEIPAVSGDEDTLAKAIIEDVGEYADELRTDALGNIIVFKRGADRPVKKVMLDAHMDEIGFIITGVTSDGFLRFDKCGGIDDKVLLGKRVKIGGIYGVIGGCPVHLLDADKRTAAVDFDELTIDIGAADRNDALSYVKLGDRAVFDSGFMQKGGMLFSRALDDRAGCAVLADMLRTKQRYDAWYTFTVQEEVGCRGAAVAAYSVNPDYALAIESTTARDLYSTPDDKRVCSLHGGVVVPFMDKGTLYDKSLVRLALSSAADNKISTQPKTAVAGATNSSTIHKSRAGISTLTLSLPCRYIHSAVCVASVSDALALRQLTEVMLCKLAAGEA